MGVWGSVLIVTDPGGRQISNPGVPPTGCAVCVGDATIGDAIIGDGAI